MIPPRRLHLTLGVMSLEDSENSNIASDGQATNSRKTLSAALSLLTSLQPQISALLRGASLKIPLQLMDIMPPDGGDPNKAHVLWVGPPHEHEDAQRLRKVGGERVVLQNFSRFTNNVLEMVNKTFREAGFIRERRALKVCCVLYFSLAMDRDTRSCTARSSTPPIADRGGEDDSHSRTRVCSSHLPPRLSSWSLLAREDSL